MCNGSYVPMSFGKQLQYDVGSELASAELNLIEHCESVTARNPREVPVATAAARRGTREAGV